MDKFNKFNLINLSPYIENKITLDREILRIDLYKIWNKGKLYTDVPMLAENTVYGQCRSLNY